MHGGQFLVGSQPGLGCGSVRRSAAGAGGHRASACDLQKQKGSLPHGHNTACPMAGPLDKLSPLPAGHSSPDLGHLQEETKYQVIERMPS